MRGRPVGSRSVNWRGATIEVTTGPEEQPGRTFVAGWIHPDIPGLALTATTTGDMLARGVYAITHRQSGRALADGLSFNAAKKIAAEIGGAADWTVAVEKLSPALQELTARAVERFTFKFATLKPPV